jgi:release factor glutamine methyltransferase
MNEFKPLTVLGASQWALTQLDSEFPEDDVKYLLSYVLQKSFTWLKTWPEQTLTQDQVKQLAQLIQRRHQGEPIAYITGQRDFWTLTLKTNSSTLIPRPETELLVELGIQFLAERQSSIVQQKILDLGTGTGAIALAIASERTQDKVTAVDFQKDAVTLAKQNAKLNKVENIEISQSDWFSNIAEKNFDLILSNPPYIEDNDPHLSEGDLIYEPRSALVASDKGLADIKTIVKQGAFHLVRGGKMMIEHGFQQGKAVREIFVENGYQNVTTVKDLSELDRVTIATL